jgi:tetratricopeptide (TPR) repeat protein
MKRRVAWVACLELLLPLLAPLAAPANAVEDEPVDLVALELDRTKKAVLHPVRRRISRYLEAATKAVDQGKPDEGRALLARLEPKRLNPYERALVFRLEAHLAYFASDYKAAREHFEKVLAEEVLPVRDENRIRFNLAQLHAAAQEWREALAALDRWKRYVPEPDPLALYLRSVAHYQLDELDQALANVKQAVDLSPEPLEGWLGLLAALYIQREEFSNAAPVIEQLVARFPAKKQYWVQLALVYGALEDYPKALAVQQLAYRQGMLIQDKDLRRLVRSSLHQGTPFWAAQILEHEIKEGTIKRDSQSLELLANSWIAAREYEQTLPAMEEAAKLAADGNLYVRLGQVYMQRELWQGGIEALQQGIEKGGLKDPGNAQLLLGICYFNAERVDQARSSFARAREHDSSREAADRWMTHLESNEAG